MFIGLSPLWGFHTGLAIAIAVFFRLNKAITIIASNISLPPFIPFIVFAGHEVGAYWMGSKAVHLDFGKEITLTTIANSYLQYVLGSFTLAFVVAVLLGLLTFLLLNRRKSKMSAP